MITFFKTENNRLEQLDTIAEGCWVNVVSPDEKEISYLVDTLKLDNGFVRSSLDEEETSRIESEDDQTLVIIDVPVAEKQSENTILYTTMPIGIIIADKVIYTISLKENAVLSEFAGNMVKNVQTHLRTRFLFTLLLRIATRYLQYLKQIDKISHLMEQQLHKSMKNKELIQLLGLEKSLVYFSTSLKANDITLEKILRGRFLKLYDDDKELLEDVLIEIKQAIEMSSIYSDVLSGMMDAFASIISNNLNIVMKVLTSITIVMAIPSIISGFYGMNVTGLPLTNLWWFPIVLSVVAMVVVGFILVKKKLF
ncbi:magnesium transporter CorA family protein [Acetanaerobacterium elongatum]|uniref:Magnesium transporter n=1 Tax=Acetanaerobacterium elongatum TaxID=258515 RepID=A0A1H0CX92_9FIRM|nr:magnesium transporter CorA family protein [Acetanaerobacterium elongatum]SDN62488.1 magnesium transporter [Acetanaerobacterium elongatum]